MPSEMDFAAITKNNISEMSDEQLTEHLTNIRKRIRDKETGKVKAPKKQKSQIQKLTKEDQLALLEALGG